MKTGPKPKPTAIKIIEGNPGKRPLPENELKPKNDMPACPSFVKGAARREWQRLAPEIFQLGLLTRLDRAALSAYCVAWGQLEEVEQELSRIKRMNRDIHKLRKKNPNLPKPETNGMVSITSNGNAVMEPLLSVRKQAMEQMHKFLIEFGMTPASRTRISGEPGKQKAGPKSAMEKLLEGTRELAN